MIRPLNGQAEAEHCARLMSSMDPWLTLGRTYDKCLATLLDPVREAYVFEADGAIKGLIIVVVTGAFIGYIQTIAVAPEAQSQGVGAKLIAFAEARIARVSPAVFLCVSSFNPRARALYERLGYEFVGELKDYVAAGYSEYVMWKHSGPLNQFSVSQSEA